MNRRTIVIGVIAAAVIALLAFLIVPLLMPEPKPVAAMGEPTDIVKDFYQPWLEAKLSTTTDPYKEGLADSLVLGAELRASIKKADRNGLDPVLCQPVTPPEFSTRTVSATPEKVEILVMSRPSGPPEQAIVTLLPLDGGWYIDSIRCTPGEVAPEREFSFDNEGYLLKASVPAPLDATRWHLIFTENGDPGHFAPLFFTAESICRAKDGAEAPCDPAALGERSAAIVKGEMTEQGVSVKRLEIIDREPK